MNSLYPVDFRCTRTPGTKSVSVPCRLMPPNILLKMPGATAFHCKGSYIHLPSKGRKEERVRAHYKSRSSTQVSPRTSWVRVASLEPLPGLRLAWEPPRL